MANKEGVAMIIIRITTEELDKDGKLLHLHETEIPLSMISGSGDVYDQRLLEEARKGFLRNKEIFDAFRTLSSLSK